MTVPREGRPDEAKDVDGTGSAGPLTGVRVLDSSQMLAGPLCGMRLGDLGADVLKIEPPGHGEWTRQHGFADAALHGETTAVLGLNRNKRSVTLNLKHPDGRAALHELARHSDVFIQNFRPGTADRLGVGWPDLHAVNPRLVYCSISGYGETGPLADRPGQDLILQGYSGSMWSVGRRGDPPQPGALWAPDAMTAYQAAIGVLAALRHRDRTGEGQKVEVDMLSVVMDAQAQELTTYLNLGLLPERSMEPLAHAWVNAPYGVYETKDGYLVLAMAAISDLGTALEDEWMRSLTDWSDGHHHRDEVYRRVSAITPSRSTADWLEHFDAHGIWAGPVYTYADLASDPQVADRGLIIEVEHPVAGRLRLPAPPIRLSATPSSVRLPPPTLGQHTDEVLEELLGYSTERLGALHADGAA